MYGGASGGYFKRILAMEERLKQIEIQAARFAGLSGTRAFLSATDRWGCCALTIRELNENIYRSRLAGPKLTEEREKSGSSQATSRTVVGSRPCNPVPTRLARNWNPTGSPLPPRPYPNSRVAANFEFGSLPRVGCSQVRLPTLSIRIM